MTARMTLSAVLAAVALTAQPAAPAAGKPTQSAHVPGPHGLEGWTLADPIPDVHGGNEPIPFAIVIARNGHVLRRIQGEPTIWKWIFWDDGRQVAYEAGPLHFSVDCVLVDLGTGREQGRMDCFHDLPANAPAWARAVDAAE